MKRYSLQMLAGVPVELDHPGRFFTMLSCVSPVEVSLQTGGLRAEVLESITPGIWCDFDDENFTRVRIVSPIDQHIAFMVSMVRSGWASPPPSSDTFITDAANLAASASVSSPTIDLGDAWADVMLGAQLMGGTASAGGTLAIYCGDDPGLTNIRHATGYGFSGSSAASITGGQVHLSSARATGRYARVSLTNGATQQAATAKVFFHVNRNVTG